MTNDEKREAAMERTVKDFLQKHPDVPCWVPVDSQDQFTKLTAYVLRMGFDAGLAAANDWVDVRDRLPELGFVADVTVQNEHDAHEPPTFDTWIEREVEFRGDHWLIRDDGYSRQNYRFVLNEVVAWRERQQPYQPQTAEPGDEDKAQNEFMMGL